MTGHGKKIIPKFYNSYKNKIKMISENNEK